jgi:hypothetical protein
MDDEKEEDKTLDSKDLDAKSAEVTLNALKIHEHSVRSVIDYVIRNTGIGKDKIASSQDLANKTLDDLGESCEYFGEVVLSVCFCYDGCLKSMIDIVSERLEKSNAITLEEIAMKVYENISIGGKDIQ